MKKVLAGLALALVLTSCSAEAPAPIEVTDATATAEKPAASNDLTKTVKALLGKPDSDVVTSAIEEEPGRIIVETTLVDPRGKDGSTEAKRALAICEMLAEKNDVDYVSIKESDGTNWVLYGHPMVPKGECGEV